MQPLDAVLEGAPAPLADGALVDAHARRDGAPGLPVGAGEHDLRPAHEAVGERPRIGEAGELVARVRVEDDGCGFAGHDDAS